MQTSRSGDDDAADDLTNLLFSLSDDMWVVSFAECVSLQSTQTYADSARSYSADWTAVQRRVFGITAQLAQAHMAAHRIPNLERPACTDNAPS